jgi:hypothetical protein
MTSVPLLSLFSALKRPLRVPAGALGLLLGLALLAQPAPAMIKMTTDRAIDGALIYGMQNQKMGLSNLLGPNWIEGENGALLNIYSPFMVLADKASRGGFPRSPSKGDISKARTKYGKYVHFYKDTHNRLEVKFAVSFYGKGPDFAKGYTAKIVGFGRGKDFEIKPNKQILDQIADPIDGGKSYEAINAYYFRFDDLENLQEFRLILESPTADPLTFRINNERLY